MKIKLSFLVFIFSVSSVWSQDFALEQLNLSPRHHEWVEVPAQSRIIKAFVAYPENAEDSLVVIVIHENRGLTDWVRSFADQLAEAGYIAIAPDLLSEFDEDHDGTEDFESPEDAKKAIYQLEPDQVTSDLVAVEAYATDISSASGNTVVLGFCWGGKESFRFATHSSDITAAFVFYGSAPNDKEDIQRITEPVYAFYGEKDRRINSKISRTEKLMKKYEKVYEYEIYDGAGHAFMRHGDDPEGSPENKAARDAAWVRLRKLLTQFQ